MRRTLVILMLAGGLVGWTPVQAELVYRPINPSFGGNPLNGNFLLGRAQAQDKHKDPDASLRSLRTQRTAQEDFAERLQRAVLSNLSRLIVDAAFGDTLDAGIGAGGVYETNDFSVEIITTDPDVMTVNITDKSTGGVTQVEVPLFGTQ